MKPLLSILIPTVVGREEQFDGLCFNIVNQFNGPPTGAEHIFGDIVKGSRIEYGECELVYLKDNKEIPIGEKREMLYEEANGLYSIMVDDDDKLADNAIELILEAIKSNPEIPVITFKENCMMNGEYKTSNHSIRYEKWADNFDGYDFVRCPFYKDVIRTDIAKQVPFERVRWNEDEKQSMALKPYLTDEIHLDTEIYYYIYQPTESHAERYGFK